MTNENEFINCALPDPLDDRDWRVATIYPPGIKIPKTLDLRSQMLEPRSQGSRGTCAAFTAAAVKEYHERIDIGFKGYMSPEFVYFHRSNKPSGGMYGRDVMKILNTIGIVPEYLLEYQKEDVPKISNDLYNVGKNLLIHGYAKINTIDELKTALYQDGVCYISFPTFKHRPEFWRASKDEERTGGHAVSVVGYTKKGFIIRNSWGSTWNKNGHVIYPFNEWGSHWDCWTCVDAKSSTIKQPPATSNNFLIKLFKMCKTG